jgi:hypothetical protein
MNEGVFASFPTTRPFCNVLIVDKCPEDRIGPQDHNETMGLEIKTEGKLKYTWDVASVQARDLTQR